MAVVTDRAWDGSASRWPTPVAYCASCLVDANSGAKTKGMCMLPVREPSGEINRNACHSAAGALAGARGASIPPDQKRAAAGKLLAIYRDELKEQPPDSLVALAGQS